MDILDQKDCGPENNRGYRYVLAIIDTFSKYVWTTPLKIVQTIKDSFENIIKSSKRSPNLLEGDRDRGIYNSTFQNFLNNNNIKLCSRNRSFGSVFVERFNRTIRDLRRPVFERRYGNWIDLLPTITKHCNIRLHSLTKLMPIQPNLKKNEGYVYKKLLCKRKKLEPRFQINDVVRTADLKKAFSKEDTTNWSYKMYKISEIINDTIPSCEIDNLKERYKEALLKKTESSMKEKDSVMKKLNLI